MKLRSVLINLVDFLPITPRDFSWKMRWRMRNDHNPIFVELLDKYKVKEHAAKLGIKTAETLYVTDKPETIPFDALPKTYFLKANHGCRWNILCENDRFYLYGDGKNLSDQTRMTKYELTRKEVIRHCQTWLGTRYSLRQWAYQHIKPLILAEEVLRQREGGELKDYKFYAFYGKAELVKVFSQSIRHDHTEILLDANWQPIPLSNRKQLPPDSIPPKPESYHEMLETVRKLGQSLDFVRVDLYDTTRGVVLGEMTIYPLAGRFNSPTPDPKFNKWLGDQWVLPERTSNN